MQSVVLFCSKFSPLSIRLDNFYWFFLYKALQPLQTTSASWREFTSLALKGLSVSKIVRRLIVGVERHTYFQVPVTYRIDQITQAMLFMR